MCYYGSGERCKHIDSPFKPIRNGGQRATTVVRLGLSFLNEKARDYSPASLVRHNWSSVTFKAADSLMAVETLHSPFLSISSMVRTGTKLRRESAGMDKHCAVRICLRFMIDYSLRISL